MLRNYDFSVPAICLLAKLTLGFAFAFYNCSHLLITKELITHQGDQACRKNTFVFEGEFIFYFWFTSGTHGIGISTVFLGQYQESSYYEFLSYEMAERKEYITVHAEEDKDVNIEEETKCVFD